MIRVQGKNTISVLNGVTKEVEVEVIGVAELHPTKGTLVVVPVVTDANLSFSLYHLDCIVKTTFQILENFFYVSIH
tara:strand:- start:318 stop:545 length:228 start_codon:yes stop_codon:yes gene_type:complete